MHYVWFPRSSIEGLPFQEEVKALFFILALKFMAGGSEGDAGHPKEPAGQGSKETDVVKGSELTRGLRRGTKRTWQTGEGPPGDEEPPKDKIYVKGDYMNFKEYLAKKKVPLCPPLLRGSGQPQQGLG